MEPTKTTKEFAEAYYGNEKFYDKFMDLFTRWVDEYQYEELDDYAKALQEDITASGGGEIKKAYWIGAAYGYSFQVECVDGKCLIAVRGYENGEYAGVSGKIEYVSKPKGESEEK